MKCFMSFNYIKFKYFIKNTRISSVKSFHKDIYNNVICRRGSVKAVISSIMNIISQQFKIKYKLIL